MDLLLSESLDSLAGRTFDELRRKEQPEDDGIVEPKAVTGATIKNGVMIGAVAIVGIVLLITLTASPGKRTE